MANRRFEEGGALMSSEVTPNPVYVAGLERSGTSLLFALLASHPRLAMTRRTNLWTYFYDQFGDLGVAENRDKCIDTMMRYKRLAVLEPDEERLRRDFLDGPPTYARLFALLEQQHADRLGKPRWGDKSLHTERYASPIFAAYPEARILHMMRDPRDRYASVLARWKSRRGGVGAGMAEWLDSASHAITGEQRYPDRYKVIRYEDLASEPESTLRAICEFIGEEYTDQMLSMDGASDFRDQGANSSYGKRPAGKISTDSIGRYPDVLSSRQIAFIEWIAKEDMARFDYDATARDLSAVDRASFTLLALPFESVRLTAWRVRHRYRDYAGRKLPSYRLLDSRAG